MENEHGSGYTKAHKVPFSLEGTCRGGLIDQETYKRSLIKLLRSIEDGTTKIAYKGGVRDERSIVTTPSEINFAVQLATQGFIEIDLAFRARDPFRSDKTIVGSPTRIRGLEPGEIWKLQTDLQGWLMKWRMDIIADRQRRDGGETTHNLDDIGID